MKSLSVFFAAAIFWIPLITLAQAQNSTIISENTAVSSSGGIVVSGSSESAGTGSASVDVRSVIRNGGGRSEVLIDIKTESDGVVQRESVRKSSPAGESLKVEIATSTGRVRASLQNEIRPAPLQNPSARTVNFIRIQPTSTRGQFTFSNFVLRPPGGIDTTRLNFREFFGRVIKSLWILP